ncbi:nucleolin 1-like, partial [Centruroides sculpturatus]|uniref:nucleolin 1-like n=1 Tax=Centruroides sculpturatus TaxID=218467 RepID=UPI000C6E0A32
FQKPNTSELEETAESTVKVDSEGFKIPPVPGMKGSQNKSPIKQEEEVEMEPERKRQKLETEQKLHGETVHHDPKKDERTIFLSNLSYDIDEEQIREVFSKMGDITDLRLVRDYKGRSKGYCYLEFATE